MNVYIMSSMDAPCKFEVRERKGAPRRYDDEPTNALLFGPAPLDECESWCYDHGHEYRIRRMVALVPPNFLMDLEARCDEWYSSMASEASLCGRVLSSDITYRASAAWKEQPTHYCYTGDLGSVARLVKRDDAADDQIAEKCAQGFLNALIGASIAVHELGFVLTFNKDGKHTVFNASAQWVTLDSED